MWTKRFSIFAAERRLPELGSGEKRGKERGKKRGRKASEASLENESTTL